MFLHRLFAPRQSIAGTTSAQQRQRRKDKRWHATGLRRVALLEPLEPRLLLAASVITDRLDYAPGATAIVSGSGFTPGETVQLQVLLADGTPGLGSNPWQVEDGDNSFTDPYQDANDIWHYPDLDGQVDGNLQTTWYVNAADETNATMQLRATGLSSGELAQTTFTDSAMLANIGVAHDTGSAARTRLPASLTAAVAVGKTMVVAVALNTRSDCRVTIADNAAGGSNVYTKRIDSVNASGARLLVFTSTVARALEIGNTVTVTTPKGISDKSMQVSSGNVVYESSTTNTGSGINPAANTVRTAVVGASYRVMGFNAAVSSGTETLYGNSGNPWYNFASEGSNPGAARNTIVWGAFVPVVGAANMYFPSTLPTQSLANIGTLSVPGPWAATLIAFREVVPVSSTISYPANGKTYTYPAIRKIVSVAPWSGSITGTAADTGGGSVSSVKLSIRDTTTNQYWSGSAWSGNANTRLTATGTTSWSYSFPSARLAEGHTYTVTSFATNNTGVVQIPGTIATFTIADLTVPTVNLVIVTPPPSSYFLGAGNTLQITVGFSERILVTGTPRLQLNTTPTAYATYASGSGTTQLKFNYTVVAGQNSPRLAYTSTTALTLNGGTIRDAAGNNANLTLIAPGSPMDNLYLQNIVVDTIAPVVSSVSVSPSPTGTAPTISAALTDVNSAATSRIAAGEYFVDVLGAAGTGTSLSLSPTNNSTCTGSAVLSGFAGLSEGPHTVYVRTRDSAGNWSAAAHTSFVKDSAMPGVTLTAPVSPTNQDPILFTVTFTQNVTGLSTAGFAATNGTVVGVSGSGAIYSVLVHPAASGVVTCQVLANAAQNATVPGKFNTPSNVASVTYDGVAPTLSSLSLQYQNAGAHMKTGSYVAFGLTFSKVVFVTDTPQLRLNTGATVNYSSGSGTTTLYFGTYFVVAGQNAAPLDFASDGALAGTIRDAAGNAVVLPTPGPSSLLYLKNITVDTTPP